MPVQGFSVEIPSGKDVWQQIFFPKEYFHYNKFQIDPHFLTKYIKALSMDSIGRKFSGKTGFALLIKEESILMFVVVLFPDSPSSLSFLIA
jgi:hypothetical protein